MNSIVNGTLERNPAPSGAGQPSYVFFSGVEERPPLTVEESPPIKEEFFKSFIGFSSGQQGEVLELLKNI